jgi:RNA polymerase sigma-70 factor (ECF subfamily)
VTEKEIIEGCLRQKRECQQELFKRYAGKMLSVCMRYARHQMEAEDVLQDAFIKIFDHLHQFQNKGSFEGWIRRVVVNTALKTFDRKSFTHEQYGLELREDFSAAEPSVFSQLSEAELLGLIARLPEGYRIVFNLYAIEGYSHAEIAETLGVQESTSRSQLVKARKMLQAMVMELEHVQKVTV